MPTLQLPPHFQYLSFQKLLPPFDTQQFLSGEIGIVSAQSFAVVAMAASADTGEEHLRVGRIGFAALFARECQDIAGDFWGIFAGDITSLHHAADKAEIVGAVVDDGDDVLFDVFRGIDVGELLFEMPCLVRFCM
jgi:hypothetical protein